MVFESIGPDYRLYPIESRVETLNTGSWHIPHYAKIDKEYDYRRHGRLSRQEKKGRKRRESKAINKGKVKKDWTLAHD